MKRVLMRTSQKFYRTGIEMYLLENLLAKCENALDSSVENIRRVLAPEPKAVYSHDWVDVGGQLMPKKRLLDLISALENGKITDLATFSDEMKKIHQNTQKDQWLWVKNEYEQFFSTDPMKLTKQNLLDAAELYKKTKTKFLKQVLADAEKDFSSLSRTGFGQDGLPEDMDEDFKQVRGQYDQNKFVRETFENIEELERRVNDFREKISKL